METRDTSLEVYRKIREGGLLSERRLQVYEVLFHHGPITAGEVWYFHLQDRAQIDSVRPRMAELEELGVIESCGERKCSYTGNVCLMWRTTGKLPGERAKRKTSSQKIKTLSEALDCCVTILQKLGVEEGLTQAIAKIKSENSV